MDAVRLAQIRADAQHAARIVAADVRLCREVALLTVEVGVVKPKPIGARHQQAAIAGQGNAPLGALHHHLHIGQAAIVGGQLGSSHHLHAQVVPTALGQGHGPHLGIPMRQRPSLAWFTGRWRQIGEIHPAVAREVRVQQHIVQTMRRNHLDGRQAFDWWAH